MKKLSHVIAKFGIGLIVNLFVILSTALNIFEFFKYMVVRIVTKLPETFNAIVASITGLLTLYFIFSPDMGDIWMKAFYVVLLLIIAGIIIRFSEIAVGIICTVLLFIVSIFNTAYIITFLRDSIMKLSDKYINFCENDIKAIERLYMFGLCYIFSSLAKLLSLVQTVLSIIVYPVFALAGAGFGYWLFFVDSAAPALWSLDFWMSIAVMVLFLIVGIYLAYVFNQAVEETTEDTDFDLFYVFETYWNTYKNYSKKSYSYTNKKAEPVQPKRTNKYLEILGKAESLEQLKKTYRRLAREVHPDVNPLSVEESTKLMADLNEAYEYYQNKF